MKNKRQPTCTFVLGNTVEQLRGTLAQCSKRRMMLVVDVADFGEVLDAAERWERLKALRGHDTLAGAIERVEIDMRKVAEEAGDGKG